ncbi:Phage minor structural protein GP20, partial [Snodgrassella alvi SCGC AB-598-O02]
YRKGSKAYELNSVWDSNNDEYIDKGEMVLNKKFKAHQRQYYTNISNNAQKASEMISQNQQMQASSNVIKNDNRKHVNVHIQNINVKTSANTVSGNTVAALKEAHNYLFNQLGTSVT